MNTKQEHIYYYCKGSSDNPEGVINALKEKGVANPEECFGNEDRMIYYVNIDNEVERAIIGTEYADLIMRCGIELKPVENARRWRDDEEGDMEGFFISTDSRIEYFSGFKYVPFNHNVFATEKQAKSALAMARISQIMANDKRFGGPITDEEWKDNKITKYVIYRDCDMVLSYIANSLYQFLAFHTEEQRDLFLKENPDLVRDFLMIENNEVRQEQQT